MPALWDSSVGSYIALRNATRLNANSLITVAPPVSHPEYAFQSLGLPNCPWLVVQGDSDEVVDPAALYAWLEAHNAEPTLVRMPETGHFFHGRLLNLREAVKQSVADWLPAPR